MDDADSDARTATIRYRGKTLEIKTFGEQDHISRTILRTQSFYEMDVLEACQRCYLPGTAIVDVGAFIGNHTLFWAAILEARKVIAIEPNGPSFELLKQNVEANDALDRVELLQVAAAAKAGTGRIISPSEGNIGQASFVMGSDSVDGLAARSITLDSIDRSLPVSIIKIDVEGSELDVLEGASSMLDRWAPHVFVEAFTLESFLPIARFMLRNNYVSFGRYGVTPTYHFAHQDPRRAINAVIAHFDLARPKGGAQALQ